MGAAEAGPGESLLQTLLLPLPPPSLLPPGTF